MSSQIVQSYASALLEMANEAGKANRFAEEVDALIPVFQDPEVVSFFKSPLFAAADKEKVVADTFGSKVDGTLADFLKLLAKNGRIGYFPQIMSEFKQNMAGGSGQKKGEVVSAVELPDAEKKSIQSVLEKKLGTPVSLEFKVQSDLIAGVETRVGSYVVEDNLKSELTKLNDTLKRSAH